MRKLIGIIVIVWLVIASSPPGSGAT